MTDIAFGNDDLNGDCFIAGAEGEPEILINTNQTFVPHGLVGANAGAEGQAVVIPNDLANSFIRVNVARLMAGTRSIQEAAKVSYIRFLAFRQGLISPHFAPAAHHVRYNHCVQLNEADTTADNDAVTDAQKNEINAILSVEVRRQLRVNFADYTCCVAYIFRVRGHHYKDDFEDRYVSLWSRCLKNADDLPLAWKFIATDALHAIMPDVLDDFWGRCVANARCAGTLIKRFDSAPAGCAGLSALRRGLEDVSMLFPRVVERVPDSYAAYKDILTQLETSRWGGSINCRFYGVARVRVDESRVGALASVVLGIYDQLASTSKLRDSPALKRLAEIAPATGGALGLAALHAIRDDAFSLLSATADKGDGMNI